MAKSKSSDSSDDLVTYVASQLKKQSDPRKAVEMAAYMKTQMPFYGVQKPARVPIIRHMKANFKPADFDEYSRNVRALWKQPHREEKYMAINYAECFPVFIAAESLPLYEQLIREGAWWDFVDAISSNLVGHAYLNERAAVKPIIKKWSGDKDMWIRRATLISHLHHKDETDHEYLFSLCLKLAPEKEFFIQKGIGWALREYSKTNPKVVKKFLNDNKTVLAPLSFREGAKHLIRVGVMRI